MTVADLLNKMTRAEFLGWIAWMKERNRASKS